MLFNKTDCFGIKVAIQNNLPQIEPEAKEILRLDASSSLSLKNPTIIKADPFLFVKDNTLFLFYEELKYFSDGGKIMMIKTTDLVNWSKPITVLQETNTHFSFPYVFEEDDEVYMIPESGWTHTIRLYKATTKDLTHFEFITNIQKRESVPPNIKFDYCDNLIHKKNNVYYLFSSVLEDDSYKLLLYTSRNLTGPYTEHPKSPVVSSLKYGRNAGPIITDNQEFYRPAQDCSECYGGNVNIFKIENLTETDYKESLFAENQIPLKSKFQKLGGHQLSIVLFNGNIVVATDAKRVRVFLIYRIINKIQNLLRRISLFSK